MGSGAPAAVKRIADVESESIVPSGVQANARTRITVDEVGSGKHHSAFGAWHLAVQGPAQNQENAPSPLGLNTLSPDC